MRALLKQGSVQLNCTPDLTPRHMVIMAPIKDHAPYLWHFPSLCGARKRHIVEEQWVTLWKYVSLLLDKDIWHLDPRIPLRPSHSLTSHTELGPGVRMFGVRTFILFKDQVLTKHLLSNLGHRLVRVSVRIFVFVKISHPFRRIFQ